MPSTPLLVVWRLEAFSKACHSLVQRQQWRKKSPDGIGDWKEIVRRGEKVVTPPPTAARKATATRIRAATERETAAVEGATAKAAATAMEKAEATTALAGL